MNKRVNRKKELTKMALGAFAAIGACAVLFNGITEAAMASEIGKVENVPTSYSSAMAEAAENTVPAGYTKADYQAVQDSLAYYNDKKPSAKDLTLEAAAELGAQMIWEVFGTDLNGTTIYMGYNPGTDTFPRAFWSGDVRFGSTREPEDTCYTFMIDAVTGERFTTSYGRTLDKDVPLGLDKELAKNPGVYTDLAKQITEKLNLVQGTIESATYNSQGYGGNDPDITIDVYGTSGLKASMTFSRYDQTLKGIGYDAGNRISEDAFK